MVRKRYGWIAVVLLVIIVTGCSQSTSPAATTEVYKGKAIEGISDAAWIYTPDAGPFLSDPLVTEENTYVGSDEKLYAIDTKTGELRWEQSINGIPSKPAIANGTLLYHDNTGIHAIEVDTGQLIWSHQYNEQFPDSKPRITSASTKSAFIIERSKECCQTSFKALNIRTGEVDWSLEDDIEMGDGFLLNDGNIYIPTPDQVLILKQDSGQAVSAIETEIIATNLAVTNELLFTFSMDGNVTAYDLDTLKPLWHYEYDLFQMPSFPELLTVNGQLIITDIRQGNIIALDTESGSELWKQKFGDEKHGWYSGWIITSPTVLENTIYIAAWGGELQEPNKGMPAYSDLIAIDAVTGEEEWRYQVDKYIMYAPAFAQGRVIVINMQNSITAYNEGKASEYPKEVEAPTVVEDEVALEPEGEELIDDEEYHLKDFEGNWISDKQTFNIAFIDGEFGIITFYRQGEEIPELFEYKMNNYNSVMLVVGEGESPAYLRLQDINSMDYADQQGRDSLVRQDHFDEADDSPSDLTNGFEGKWCDSEESFCFELIVTEINRSGMLHYYQDTVPYQEGFRFIYMDGTDVVLEMEAGASQVSLSLSADMQSMTYESDFSTAIMPKQD